MWVPDALFSSILIVLMASALQSATGFGFSLLALPLLLLVHPSLVAVEINLIVSVVLCLVLVRTVHSQCDYRLVVRLMASSVLGAPLGLALLLYVDERLFRIGIGVLILIFMGLLWWRLRFQRTPLRDSLAGLLAGVFTSAVGMGGIPLLVYFAGARTPKAVVRATAIVFFLFIYTLALILQVMAASTGASVWWLSLLLVPAALVGSRAGQWLYARISQRTFTLIIWLILIGNSAFLLLSQL